MNQLISIDPEIMHGKPCVKGTRIPISLFVNMLADGMREDEILKDFPSLNRKSIHASLKYAAMPAE
ncbi:MAG: DUF433 domain-containing protein [Bacteroidia bacterium]